MNFTHSHAVGASQTLHRREDVCTHVVAFYCAMMGTTLTGDASIVVANDVTGGVVSPESDEWLRRRSEWRVKPKGVSLNRWKTTWGIPSAPYLTSATRATPLSSSRPERQRVLTSRRTCKHCMFVWHPGTFDEYGVIPMTTGAVEGVMKRCGGADHTDTNKRCRATLMQKSKKILRRQMDFRIRAF